MPAISLSPPTRFLLRGSVLLAAWLTLWWLVLINPLQSMLRTTASVCGALLFSGHPKFTITDADNGGWTFDVPIEPVTPPAPPRTEAHQIYSISFDMARTDAGGFTFGLPVFWALMLAAPELRRNWRSLLKGTLAVAALEVALVLITAKILAYKALAQILHTHDPVQGWFLGWAEYLAVNAIPYLLPFAVAIAVHRELREQIFQWTSPASTRSAPSRNRAAVKRENRKRAAANSSRVTK